VCGQDALIFLHFDAGEAGHLVGCEFDGGGFDLDEIEDDRGEDHSWNAHEAFANNQSEQR
jgi:hypothetical protein